MPRASKSFEQDSDSSEDGRTAFKAAVSRGLGIRSPANSGSSAGSAVPQRELRHHSVPWRPGGWTALAALLPTAVAVGVTLLFLRPASAIEREPDAQATKGDRRPPNRDPKSPVPADGPALPTAGVADRSDIEASSALALLPQAMPPRVIIRFLGNSAEARRRANDFAKALTGQGIEVSDVRESAAPIGTELRFSYAPDLAIAQQVGRVAGIPPMRAALTKDGLMPRPGTVQLSISVR